MVKYLNCEQGSPRWLAARLGKPTASMYSCIVSPTGKPVTGAKRATYMAKLIGERLAGLSSDSFTSAAMERGHELEPFAREWYEWTKATPVQETGFAYDQDQRAGASPDGLVLDDGGLEIKCPLQVNHIKHLIAGVVPKDWIVQVHGCIWLCNRQWWDFVCFCDDENVPNMLIRTERDDKMMAAFDEHIAVFCNELDETEARIRKEYGLGERVEIALDKLSGVCETEESLVQNMEEMEASEL